MIRLATTLLLASAAIAAPARAAEPLKLVLKDHHFEPSHLEVPVNTRFRIQLTNQDDTTAEFESHDLKFEKLAVPGATITVSAGPLHPGTYSFFDDFRPDTTAGTLTATAPKH